VPFERYEIRLIGDAIVVVDLAEVSDRAERYAAIVATLRKNGATEVTTHTFSLRRDSGGSILNLQSLLCDFVKVGDAILVIADSDRGMTCTAFVFNDSKEGITVQGATRA